jgi:succinate dehydrogenase hydrophobic anchor subunit
LGDEGEQIPIRVSDDYPSDWETRREEVYRRDGYECQQCGARGGPRGSNELHAHHVIPKSEGGSHQYSNLATLCESCHREVHGGSATDASRQRRGSLWSVLLSGLFTLVIVVLGLTAIALEKLGVPDRLERFVRRQERRNRRRYGTKTAPLWRATTVLSVLYLTACVWIVLQGSYAVWIPLTVGFWLCVLPCYVYERSESSEAVTSDTRG